MDGMGGGGESIRVEVLTFARIREICGSDRLVLRLPAGSTAEDCLRFLEIEHPPLASLRGRLLAAVNEGYADWSTELTEGDSLALIPPVSGG